MTDITVSAEDCDYLLDLIIFEAKTGEPVYVEVSFAVGDVQQLYRGGEGIIHLGAVQALVDGCSPVGCNSCDLGDVLVPHRFDCPTNLVPFIAIRFHGDVDDA